METNFNIGSLKIVSTPLLEYFKKIQNNLSENIQLVSDKKVSVNFESIEILKKVNGTLKMIGLVGVNKVLTTVRESLELVKSAKYDTAKSLAVLQASSQIISSVVFYLENLLKGEQDQPTKFFDEYSTICNLIGKESNIKDLFSPRLDFRSESDADLQADLRVGAFVNEGNKEKLVDLLKRNHEIAQKSIVYLFEMLNKHEYNTSNEKERYQNVIENLYSVLDVNQKLNLSKNVYLAIGLQKLFLSIISPVFNDNFNDLVSYDLNSIKLNLGKIERSSKFLLDSILKMDESDKTGTLKLEEDVSREVLFFVINVLNQTKNAALKNMPVYKGFVSLFDLDFYINQLKETKVEVSLMQKSPEIAIQIDKLFVEIKEELSLLTSKQAEKEDFALQHSVKFISVVNKFSDLINPVSSEKLKDLIALISTAITSVKNKEIKLSESLQKEISLSLVLIEYGVNNFVKSVNTQKEGFDKQVSLEIFRLNLAISDKQDELANTPMPVLDSGSQRSDERKAFLIIFDKLHKNLKKSEEILNDLFRDSSDTEDLDQVFKTLNSAKGIFSIINKNDLSDILTKVITIWRKVGEEGFGSVDSKELANSVSLLSGILLFIEASKNDNESEANEMYNRIMVKSRGVKEVEESHKSLNIPKVALEEYNFNSNVESVQELAIPELEVLTVDTEQEIVLSDLSFETEKVTESFESESFMPEVSIVKEEVPVSVSSGVYIDTSEDPDLTEVYLMEAEEVLDNITKSCEVLSNNLQDVEEVTNIRRYFHTLKGSGRMVGLKYLGEAGWMVEQTLNKVLNSDLELTNQVLTDIVLTKNQFDSWVKELKVNGSVTVDLAKYKKIWLNNNSHLTNQIDIPLMKEVNEVEAQEKFDFVQPIEEFNTPEVELLQSLEQDLVLPEVVSNEFSSEEIEVKPLAFEPLTAEEDSNQIFKFEDENNSEESSENLDSFEVDLGDSNEEINNSIGEVMEPAEEKKDTVSINGMEVSLSLYQLFKEESDVHLKELRASTHNHEDLSGGFEVSKDFMRHAHTLASIAKSVNMDVFSSMVAKIEFIANICIDKDIKLDESDFFILKNAIDNLDVFANVVDSSLESNEHYEDVNAKLDELLNSLTNLPEENLEILESEEFLKNVEQEEVLTPITQEVSELESLAKIPEESAYEPRPIAEQMDISSLISAISSNLSEVFRNNLESLKDSLESVKDEVASIKNSKIENEFIPAQNREEIDVNALIDSINQKVGFAVNEQYEKLSNALKQRDSENQEKTESLNDKIADLVNGLEVLSKNQENIEKTQKENHEAIRKDLRYLNYTIKKKHNISPRGMVQEVNEQINAALPLISHQVEVVILPPDVNNEGNFDDLSNDLESVVENSSEILEEEKIYENEEEMLKIEGEDFSQEDIAHEMSTAEFENLDVLPSDVIQSESLKVINENLNQVKSSNTILNFLNNNEFVKTIFEEKVSIVEDEIDSEIFEISKPETDENLEKIQLIMESINGDVLDLAQNDELKRCLHTLKGSVRMAGANKVGAIAHRLESLLDYSESRQISLFKMKDLLTDEMNKVIFLLENISVVLTKDKANWIDGSYEMQEEDHLPILLDNASVIEDVQVKYVTPVVKKEEKQFIRIGANLIDGLINEAGEVRLTRTTLEGMLVGNRRSLNELKTSSEKLIKNLKEIEVQAESQITARKEKQQDDKDFDPLEFDRFTRLQELTRFMNESVSDVQDTVSSMEIFLKTQEGAVVQQAILTNNLLDTLMKVRLFPVDNISDRLYKITRNTAKELNKKVTLELFGEKTEMDRLVLDKIVSPLEHLLRNCIAHGIEYPEVRLQKGKSPLGKVIIKTSVDGNFIVMNVKDDGAGIDVEKVRSLGLKKGLLKNDIEYSQQQIIELIFNSGFSTSDSITQVSGRGVGMDVVKKEISELGGSIEIKTLKDQGTEFNIILPVAVATNQAMLTKIAGKLVAIPALIVDEVSSLKKDKMQSAYMSGQVEIKGNKYPVYYLGHILGLTPVSQLPELKVYNTLISVTYLGETIVVHVDELQTTSEILIKSMGIHFGKISGVLGATLLGDGRQGLVVNPVMLKNHFEQNIKGLNIFAEDSSATGEKMTGVITVMVVDDSITVRRATTKVLERYGYNIVLAKDGEDGLEKLQVVIPDIILSDIEMPRMDGFEFAKNVKNTEKYSHIPIVMITSRTAEKHKNYAYSLGVDGFLGKPYQEDELINTIKRLVGILH